MGRVEKFGLSTSMTSGDSSAVAPSLTTPPSPTLYEEFLESLREELLPERKQEDEREAGEEADEERDDGGEEDGEGAGVKKEVEEVSVAERGRQDRAEEDELEGRDLMREGRAVGEEEEVPLELRGMSSMLQRYLLSLTSHPPPLSKYTDTHSLSLSLSLSPNTCVSCIAAAPPKSCGKSYRQWQVQCHVYRPMLRTLPACTLYM